MIAVEASPVRQYDLMMISGDYGYRRHLSANIGTEGVGRAIAVGSERRRRADSQQNESRGAGTRRRLHLPETVTDMLIERSDDNG